MLSILIIFYFLLFFFLAWKNFRLAVILFIIFLPAYLIRFQIGPLPSTALELSFGALFLVWLIKYSRHDFRNILAISRKHKILFIAFDLFFIASVVSIFVSDMPIPSLGQWRAYFLEPMILFLILVGRCHSHDNGNPDNRPLDSRFGGNDKLSAADLIWGLALSTLSISIYAIFQKFALGADRTTSFFTSPNSVGLYLGPVILLMLIEFKNKWVRYFLAPLSLVVIFFTKSQGAWVALAVSGVLFAFIVGYRKVAVILAIGGIVFLLAFPSMRQAALFQDQAGQNRLRLWGYTRTFLGESPENFILGAGVRQFFRKIQKPYYDDTVMERLIYPHNIFLNFWTEIGLLGMLAAMVIMGYAFYLAGRIRKHSRVIGAGLLGSLAVLVVHGLVDVPYFKNDLAFLFWIIIILPVIIYENIYQSQTVVV